MFIRKLYYDLSTGEAVDSYMMQGSVYLTTEVEDYATNPKLRNRTPADTGVLIWTDINEERESKFTAAASVAVDLATGELIFTERQKKEKNTNEATEADYIASLEELGVSFDE